MDNVNKDKRFGQKQGANPQSTIGRMQSYVNEAEGFARKARYYVEFFLPTGVSSNLPAGDFDTNVSSGVLEDYTFPDQSQLNAAHNQNGRRVRAFCNTISMPDRTFDMKEIKHHGPERKFAYNYKSLPITASFYADKFLRERSYFELWQNSAYSLQSHNFNYYDNYVADINIFQLGSYISQNERDDVTYAVKLFDCYPSVISNVEYSHDANVVQTFSVTFTFRHWVNYFIDRAGNIELGQSDFRDVTVKEGQQLFGGLLGRLPPELRRTGRDVLNQVRRSIPIGKVTGGRAFPPFPPIPPINI